MKKVIEVEVTARDLLDLAFSNTNTLTHTTMSHTVKIRRTSRTMTSQFDRLAVDTMAGIFDKIRFYLNKAAQLEDYK